MMLNTTLEGLNMSLTLILMVLVLVLVTLSIFDKYSKKRIEKREIQKEERNIAHIPNIIRVELLNRFLDHYTTAAELEPYYASGLCLSLISMFIKDQINNEEYAILHSLIKINKPADAGINNYYWKRGDTEVRIKFLKDLINKYSE